MPTKSDIESVREQIEILIEERAFARMEGDRVAVAPHARGTEDGYCFWGELSREQQVNALTSQVRWLGFEVGEIVEVSERVMEGESMEFWFDGIAVTDAVERREELFAEWREDERAARVRDGLDAPAWRPEFDAMFEAIASPPRLESDYEKAIQQAADLATRQQDKDCGGPER